MIPSSSNFFVAGFLAAASTALAGFNPESSRNVAVYWGQNSGEVGQERLAYYCNNASIDIINLAFINGITPVTVNFASASNQCTKSSNSTSLLLCREIEEDIKACHKKDKTILISMGGKTSTAPDWSTDSDVERSAKLIWGMFGPVTSTTVDRPFGTAVVDGFDFDFETPINHLPAFGGELRRLIDSATDKHKLYLSAAPQCVHPDANVGSTMDTVPFDIVQIQFYNSACGINKFQ